MKFEILNQPLHQTETDVKVVFVVKKDMSHLWIEDKESLELLGFKGESEETLFIPNNRTLYVGCDSLEADEIRLATAKTLESL
ncbi:MAG: leucyl aminopeptidase, partial [Campylobacterales bacterium]|nr:leucyl aminopeptidase [Campylobacterales bacterium]